MILFLTLALLIGSPSAEEASADAHLDGSAMLDCTVTRAGGLSGCVVKSESPPNHGIGVQALIYAQKMSVPLGEGPGLYRPGSHFTKIFKIKWEAEQGSATVKCRVLGDGHLTDCKVVSKEPKDANVDAAALEAARQIKVKPGSQGDLGGYFTTRIVFKSGD